MTPLSSLQACLSAAGITFAAPGASSFQTARRVGLPAAAGRTYCTCYLRASCDM